MSSDTIVMIILFALWALMKAFEMFFNRRLAQVNAETATIHADSKSTWERLLESNKQTRLSNKETAACLEDFLDRTGRHSRPEGD